MPEARSMVTADSVDVSGSDALTLSRPFAA
jgi:hypothetical protein